MRTNSFAVFNAMEADLVHLMVQTRMSIGCGQPVSHMEASTVLHYAVGQTIGYHYDFVDPADPGQAEDVRIRGHRVATFLIYLNDGYQGGETVFPRIGVSHAGQRGEGLLFVNTLPDGQPDLRTLHSGEPPTQVGRRHPAHRDDERLRVEHCKAIEELLATARHVHVRNDERRGVFGDRIDELIAGRRRCDHFHLQGGREQADECLKHCGLVISQHYAHGGASVHPATLRARRGLVRVARTTS